MGLSPTFFYSLCKPLLHCYYWRERDEQVVLLWQHIIKHAINHIHLIEEARRGAGTGQGAKTGSAHEGEVCAPCLLTPLHHTPFWLNFFLLSLFPNPKSTFEGVQSERLQVFITYKFKYDIRIKNHKIYFISEKGVMFQLLRWAVSIYMYLTIY